MSSLDPVIVLKNYLAIKVHFSNEKYDAPSKNFSLGPWINQQFLESRKDKYNFIKISKRFSKESSLREFLVSNWVYRSPRWIGDLVDNKEADLAYARYLNLSEGFTFAFETDIIILRDKMLEENLGSLEILLNTIEPGTVFPYLINLLLQKQIRIETILTLDRMMSKNNNGGIRENEMELLSGLNDIIVKENILNFLWEELYLKLRKYNRLMKPFVSKEKSLSIIKSVFKR